jgi:hypothetical protein
MLSVVTWMIDQQSLGLVKLFFVNLRVTERGGKQKKAWAEAHA